MAEESRELTTLRGSLIQVRIAGRTYDARRVPNCKVCNHPARIAIEEKILADVPYRTIAEQYSGTEYAERGETKVYPTMDYTAIWRHHRQKHLPVEAAVLREITDRRAKQLSEHYEAETERIVDGITLAEQVVAMTQLGIADGSLKPTINDGLTAAKLLQSVKADDNPVDAEVWDQAITEFFERAREIMTDEQWRAFGTALNTSPVLNAIRQRQESQPVDAEIVEETP